MTPHAICARVQLQMVRTKNIAVVMVLVKLNVARHIAEMLNVSAMRDGKGTYVRFQVSLNRISKNKLSTSKHYPLKFKFIRLWNYSTGMYNSTRSTTTPKATATESSKNFTSSNHYSKKTEEEAEEKVHLPLCNWIKICFLAILLLF